jgi:hypothetical protein
MVWDQPPEGLFQVDIGLSNLTDFNLNVFADFNADKYTDVAMLNAKT